LPKLCLNKLGNKLIGLNSTLIVLAKPQYYRRKQLVKRPICMKGMS